MGRRGGGENGTASSGRGEESSDLIVRRGKGAVEAVRFRRL